MDLDRQSLSSIDRNASERGQSQFSNPTDDSWKGAPYASKTFYVLGVFPCVHFNWPTRSCDSDIGKHRRANRILLPCSSSLLCHGVARLDQASLKSFYPYACKYMHIYIHTCACTHVPSSPPYQLQDSVCGTPFALNASFTVSTQFSYSFILLSVTLIYRCIFVEVDLNNGYLLFY